MYIVNKETGMFYYLFKIYRDFDKPLIKLLVAVQGQVTGVSEARLK